MKSNIPVAPEPQKIGRFSNAMILRLFDFPIYYIESISERHVVIAGGGGSSKTGVHNQINILELIPSGDSCVATLVMKYHTPEEIPDAVMTGSLMKDLPLVDTRLVTGGSHTTIYHIKYDNRDGKFAIPDYEILKDDLVKEELKCVKTAKGLIATGGVDGRLTIWSSSTANTKISRQIKAHGKEIDEIDIDLISQQIVTLSREECRCAVWNLSDLKLVAEFKKEFINRSNDENDKYRYRSCRYAPDTLGEHSVLLIACNPLREKTAQSRLYKLSTEDLQSFTTTSVLQDGIMAMNVSSDGRFVAFGTRSGSVLAFDVKKMRQIYKVDSAHNNAVTNVEFLPQIPESLSLTNSETCSFLSVSIDRRLVLHRPRKSILPSSLCEIIMVMFCTYIILVLYKTYM